MGVRRKPPPPEEKSPLERIMQGIGGQTIVGVRQVPNGVELFLSNGNVIKAPTITVTGRDPAKVLH